MGNRHLALDAAGYPHLAYGEDHLHYAWEDGAGWHREVADWTSRVGIDTALALDGTGRPYISYGGWGTLRYAHRDEAWHTVVLDTADDQPLYRHFQCP